MVNQKPGSTRIRPAKTFMGYPTRAKWVFRTRDSNPHEIAYWEVERRNRQFVCPTCNAPEGEACYDTLDLSTHKEARWAMSHWRRHVLYKESLMHESVMAWVPTVLAGDMVKGATVLEVGSFNVNGSVRPIIEAMEPVKYVGVDREPGDGVDLVADAENLAETLDVASWDIVISTEMLEHVMDWAVCVAQMCEMLAPGGTLVLTTRAPGFFYHPYPRDNWRFTVDGMRDLLQDMGLTDVKVIPDPQVPGVFATATMPERWRAPWADPRNVGDLFRAEDYEVTPMAG